MEKIYFVYDCIYLKIHHFPSIFSFTIIFCLRIGYLIWKIWYYNSEEFKLIHEYIVVISHFYYILPNDSEMILVGKNHSKATIVSIRKICSSDYIYK